MKKILSLLLFLLFITIISIIFYDSLPKKREYYSNGQVSITSTKKNFFHFEYKIFGEWYEFGNHEGRIIKKYYPNGEIKSIRQKLNGDDIGEYKNFYDNGQLKELGKFEKSFNKESTIYDPPYIIYMVRQKCWDEDGNEVECEE